MNKLYLKIKQSGFGFIMRSKNLTKSYIHFEDFYNSRELACKKGFTIFLILPHLGCFLKLHVQWRALYLPKRGLYRRLNCLIIIVIIPHCCFACLNPFSDKIRQEFLNANWFGIFCNIEILWSCLFGFFFILGCEKEGGG